MIRALRRAAVLVALALPALGVSGASGGLVDDALLGCSGYSYEQPFLRWLDPARYVLAPNGGFEAGPAAWTLTGGAAVVDGNEAYRVGGPADSRSLQIPAGGSATTTPMCVDVDAPTLRFFVRGSGSLLSSLGVEVLFEDALGRKQAVGLLPVAGTPAWQPTLPLPLLANVAAPLDGGTVPVAFRFTPRGAAASWWIDDVYVDPYLGR